MDAHGHKCSQRTDVIRVELINPYTHGERRHAQRPGQDWPKRGELAFMNVVHQDGIELGIIIRTQDG